MIQIDGSHGEGGGQILRSSLALSLLTQQPFRLRNIRANREKPGLQPQHLMSVRAAATVGTATVRGDALKSRELVFEPGPVRGGEYRFDIGTAGATGLVLHTVYLPLALRTQSPAKIILTGGTHNHHSPCFHFLDTTWRGYLLRIGLSVELSLHRTGFYPRGGGEVHATVHPCRKIDGLQIQARPELTNVTGFSASVGLPEHIAQRQAKQASHRLRDAGLEVDLRQEQWGGGPGSVIALTFPQSPVPTMFVGLGARGKPAERVADEAADEALAYFDSGEPVDPHSADQVVLPLAFAEEASEFRVSAVTQHLLTNVAVIRNFVDRDIAIDGAIGQPGVVRIAAQSV